MNRGIYVCNFIWMVAFQFISESPFKSTEFEDRRRLQKCWKILRERVRVFRRKESAVTIYCGDALKSEFFRVEIQFIVIMLAEWRVRHKLIQTKNKERLLSSLVHWIRVSLKLNLHLETRSRRFITYKLRFRFWCWKRKHRATAAAAAGGHCFEPIRYAISRVELIDYAFVCVCVFMRILLENHFYSLFFFFQIHAYYGTAKSGFNAAVERRCVYKSKSRAVLKTLE